VSNDSVATRYGMCRTCGRRIVNHGSGWYHRAQAQDYVPHFAEPMPVTR